MLPPAALLAPVTLAKCPSRSYLAFNGDVDASPRAPSPRRPRNGSVAPDVRAPSLRGRWHFWGCFGSEAGRPNRFLGIPPIDRIYAGVMNDASQIAAENPTQALGLPQLSVVIPTFNERDNVTTLFRRLEKTLAGIPFEAVFVDDNSPDGTWEVLRALSREDGRVRCVRRIGRRGLSGACIEGILASSAPCAAIIDADLQHDETQLPKMLALLQGGEADLGVGSRYIEGGNADSFDKQRAGAS